jgi:hypothetical protein
MVSTSINFFNGVIRIIRLTCEYGRIYWYSIVFLDEKNLTHFRPARFKAGHIMCLLPIHYL